MLPNHCEKSSLHTKPRMQNESFHLLIDSSFLSFSPIPSCSSSSATVRHFYSMDCDSLIRGRGGSASRLSLLCCRAGDGWRDGREGRGARRGRTREGRAVNAAAPVGFYCHLPSWLGARATERWRGHQQGRVPLYVTGSPAT